MRELLGGSFEAFLVQHSYNVPSHSPLETSGLPDKRLELVREWTNRGMYPHATIIKWGEYFPRYPQIPAMEIAAQIAIREKADFHLWIEDDALVFDLKCHEWTTRVADGSVGMYRNKEEGYVNSAYFLSTRSFDRQFETLLANRQFWDINKSMYHLVNAKKLLNVDAPRIESQIARLAGQNKTLLDEEAAARYNRTDHQSYFQLRRLVRSINPELEAMLALDFP